MKLFAPKVKYYFSTNGISYRNSPSPMFLKIGIIKNVVIFTREKLCWSVSLINFQTYTFATLMKWGFTKRNFAKVFSVNIAKCLRAAFLWNTSDSSFFSFVRKVLLFILNSVNLSLIGSSCSIFHVSSSIVKFCHCY